MSVDAAAVLAAKASLDGIHRSLESGFGTLVTEVETLLRDGWLGTSANGFGELFQSARGRFEHLLQEADQIAAAVPKAVDTITGTDRSNAGALGENHRWLNL
nr:WXG100 family type VII secretion target [Nocardia transvalensis]